MTFISRTFRFIYGFFLFLICARKLNFNRLVKGQRIAIIGAANSTQNSGKGEFIDGFDWVIRINKAPYILRSARSRSDIGVKCDILFHNFFENETSGGGPIDLPLYDSLGIRYIINPIPSYLGFRAMLNFYKKYLVARTTYWLSVTRFARLRRDFGAFYPTTGFCALHAAMHSDFSELYLGGFTFFKTAFADGYRDEMKEAHKIQNFLKDAGLHNPDLEFREFLKMLHANRHKNIKMDDALSSIVKNSTTASR